MSLNGDGIPMNMPVVPANSDGGNGWGGGNGWWIIILFLAIFCGWGNGNGFGNRGGNGGVVDGYVLASDFSNIERKIDVVNNGICDGFYAMNTGMLNGFAGVTQAVTSGFSQAELSRCNQQAALMQQQNTTRDIIDAMNCGFRSIDQRLTAQELAAKDAKIAEQNQQLFAAQLAASQAAQNDTLKSYVSGQLAYYNPRPVPSFAVPAPYQFAGCNGYNSGYNYGCGNCA